MNAGRVVVSMDLLAKLLNFPEGSKVMRVTDASGSLHRSFDVIVEHRSLPEVQEGEPFPEVGFTVTRGAHAETMIPSETHVGTFHVKE